MNLALARRQEGLEVIGVGACLPFDRLILRQDFDELSRVAQDDPEHRRTGQGPEHACGELVETVEGQAILTAESSFARPAEDRSRALVRRSFQRRRKLAATFACSATVQFKPP